jgi:hypothetical protein
MELVINKLRGVVPDGQIRESEAKAKAELFAGADTRYELTISGSTLQIVYGDRGNIRRERGEFTQRELADGWYELSVQNDEGGTDELKFKREGANLLLSLPELGMELAMKRK